MSFTGGRIDCRAVLERDDVVLGVVVVVHLPMGGVVLGERRIVSVGNLDVVPVAAALDFARIALASVVTTAAERAVKLLQSPLSGLPAGLAAEPGTGEEALAEFAGAAQAIAAEARTLAHPVSFELVSSSKAV